MHVDINNLFIFLEDATNQMIDLVEEQNFKHLEGLLEQFLPALLCIE